MASRRDADNERLEFETYPGRADIQVSKTLMTPEGDEIRAIVTTGDTVVLTGVGTSRGDVVILDGFDPDDEGTVVFKSFWDVVGPIIKAIAEGVVGVKGGGGKECKSETKIESDAKTGKTTVTVTMVCK